MLHRTAQVKAALTIALIVGLTGCGGDNRPATYPVSGQVIFKGGSSAGALIVFHPKEYSTEAEWGGKPFATADAEGKFRLSTYGQEDGAPAGEYGITIDLRGTAKEPKLSIGIGDGEVSGKPLLKPKYSDPNKPFTYVTVEKAGKNEFTFEVD